MDKLVTDLILIRNKKQVAIKQLLYTLDLLTIKKANIDIKKLINKHTINNTLNKKQCIKELINLTNINKDTAKLIIEKSVTIKKPYKLEKKKVIHKRHSLCCPRCKSTNIILIDDNPGGIKASIDISGDIFYPIVVKKKQKKVYSKNKIIAGMLTGGVSLLFTGIKKKVDYEYMCYDCGMKFYK